MSTHGNGGPAFPGAGPSHPQPKGMSLRDYFAANERSEPDSQFVNAFIDEALPAASWGTAGRRPLKSVEMRAMSAAWRYACADAMLAERVKP